MQFKVPQFLEIEDKIFGPFTFREFVYLAGGAGMCFVFYKWLGLLPGLIPILIMAGIALALTFYRPNDKPLIFLLESGFKYFTQNRLYIWKKGKMTSPPDLSNPSLLLPKGEEKNSLSPSGRDGGGVSGARLSGNKLRDLAWSLDVLDLSKSKNS